MNVNLILTSGIENIDLIYNGVRGTTLSSRRNMRYWERIVESGVKVVIELRKNDHSDRLCKMCERYNIRYFSFPLDAYEIPDMEIAFNLQEFFEIIDGGDFYIACAMGLHRTDLALSTYWVFHGADIGLEPPLLKGHIEDGKIVLNRIHNKVFRRLNSLYSYLSNNKITPIPDKEVFNQRKRLLIDKQVSMQK